MPGKGGKDLVMERVKFNKTDYELVTNGLQLTEQGGKIIFQPGEAGFEAVEADVRAAKTITVLDDAEEYLLIRSDLVYAGRLTKDTAHEAGTVMIAEFRTPDVREQLAVVEAKLAYVAMMTDVEMEV